MSPASSRTRTTQSGAERTANHEATAPPPSQLHNKQKHQSAGVLLNILFALSLQRKDYVPTRLYRVQK